MSNNELETAETYTPLAFDPTNPTHVEIIRRIIPDMRAVEGCVNPYSQVRFRTSMLVMREIIYNFLKNGKMSPRSYVKTPKVFYEKSWPTDWCGDDPGTPRRITFQELTIPNKWLTQEDADRMNLQSRMENDDVSQWSDYKAGDEAGWETNPSFNASLEALPEAFALLVNMGVMKP